MDTGLTLLLREKSLADNATLIDWQIRKIATTYMSTPDGAWQILTSDVETDVSSYYVTLPPTIKLSLETVFMEGAATEIKKLEMFGEWRANDANGNGITNEEEGNGWRIAPQGDRDAKITLGPCSQAGPCAKFKVNPGTIEQYPTLFDYWKSEVYLLPRQVTGIDADYIIINLAAEKLEEVNVLDLYTLQQKGGDESKAYWFLKIADLRVLDYYGPELTNFSDKFWYETLLGKLIPFTPILYVDPDNPARQSDTFRPGYTSIYVKDIKFPRDGDGPFQLV